MPYVGRPAKHGTAHMRHKRHIQQFYLHKLFDLLSDEEFLPHIPADPIAVQLGALEHEAEIRDYRLYGRLRQVSGRKEFAQYQG